MSDFSVITLPVPVVETSALQPLLLKRPALGPALA
jgi:hypothetical protein